MAAKPANALPVTTEADKPDQGKASLAKLLSHPTRVQILAAAHRQAISPSEFARSHGQTVSSVAQHFKKLAAYGAIELVRTEPVRGSVKHMYVGTKRGILTATDWQTLPESVQSDLAGAGLQDFVSVTVHAIETGSFTDREDFVFTWDELDLDETSWKTLNQMLKLLWKRASSLEEESAVRREQNGDQGMKAILGLAVYEAPKPSNPR
jgi:DNA-binding transcriptional ArsR family regulator